MAKVHHPAGSLAFGQEILTVFFGPALHCVFKFSVRGSYHASLDVSTGAAVILQGPRGT